MSAARVTTVVVTYHSRDRIGACLDAARDAHEAGLADCIVVDNGGDDTLDFVREEHPWAQAVASPENVGFGRACNQGFEKAATDYVLLLNPDAVLPAEDLARLVRFMDDHPRVGIVGPAIREPDGGLQHAGGSLTPGRMLLEAAGALARLGRVPVEPGDAPIRTDWVCGAIFLARKRMIDELGGFDPRFFMYFEETDLCRRAEAGGWEIWAVGEAVGGHSNAGSSESTDRPMMFGCIGEYFFPSRFHYLVKHFGWPRATVAELAEFALILARYGWRRLRRRPAAEFAKRLHASVLRLPPEPVP